MKCCRNILPKHSRCSDDAERIVHVLSWHQIQDDDAIGKALDHIKEQGLIPDDEVRLCVIGDGAPWIWNQIQERFPQARQVLDYYHCSERIHRVAISIYGEGLKGSPFNMCRCSAAQENLLHR